MSNTRHHFLRHLSSRFAFIDEFRLLATTGVPVKHVRELGLVMFDTSVPQQSPDNWQPSNLVPAYTHQHPRASWSCDRTQGEGSCDGPLVIDPPQSVVVLALNGRGAFATGETVLVIHTRALVGYMPSTHTCRRILWDEWKRDVMVVKVPRGVSYIWNFIIGSRVLLMTRIRRNSREGYRFQVYDFSRWGCRALVRVGRGEKEITLMPNPKKVWFPREYLDGVRSMRVLGDSIVSCGVSDSLEPRAHRRLISGARRVRSLPVTYMPGSWPSRRQVRELDPQKGTFKLT